MSRTSRAPGAEPQTKAGRGLLSGHGHRPVEGDEPDQQDNLWCAADDEPWPCPFAVSLYLVEVEARQQGRDPAIWELMAAARWIVLIHADNIVIKERDLALWEDLGRLRRALGAAETQQGTR